MTARKADFKTWLYALVLILIAGALAAIVLTQGSLLGPTSSSRLIAVLLIGAGIFVCQAMLDRQSQRSEVVQPRARYLAALITGLIVLGIIGIGFFHDS